MSKITQQEKAWLAKVQKLLDQCPSKRIGFYATGDCSVGVYDSSRDAEINDNQDEQGGEFCNAVDRVGARLGNLDFPGQVASMCC